MTMSTWAKNSRRLGEQDIAPINEAIAYIDRHLSENIRLADLAAIAHVSPAYFSTLFKRLNGLSPIEYIVHKRIQLAVEEICTTTKKPDRNRDGLRLQQQHEFLQSLPQGDRTHAGILPSAQRGCGCTAKKAAGTSFMWRFFRTLMTRQIKNS